MESDLKILIQFSERKISSNSVIPIIKKIDPNTKTDLNLLSQNALQLSEILKLCIQNMNISLRNIENEQLVSKENRMFELNVEYSINRNLQKINKLAMEIRR